MPLQEIMVSKVIYLPVFVRSHWSQMHCVYLRDFNFPFLPVPITSKFFSRKLKLLRNATMCEKCALEDKLFSNWLPPQRGAFWGFAVLAMFGQKTSNQIGRCEITFTIDLKMLTEIDRNRFRVIRQAHPWIESVWRLLEHLAINGDLAILITWHLSTRSDHDDSAGRRRSAGSGAIMRQSYLWSAPLLLSPTL